MNDTELLCKRSMSEFDMLMHDRETTDKVFTENGRDKGDADFKALLESELGHPVIIIPWEPNHDDKFGHADGFVKWCGGNRILMADCTIYQIEMTEIARLGGALHCISWNILPPA